MAKIINIYIYPEAGANGIAQSTVKIIAGSGIVGDRYYKNKGTFTKDNSIDPKQEITFIESEKIDAFNLQNSLQLGYQQLRRNIITRNVNLNDLVDKEFTFGDQLFRGIELCEPCGYLAKKVEPKLLPQMIGKCGLRVQILSSGNLNIDDEFTLTK